MVTDSIDEQLYDEVNDMRDPVNIDIKRNHTEEEKAQADYDERLKDFMENEWDGDTLRLLLESLEPAGAQGLADLFKRMWIKPTEQGFALLGAAFYDEIERLIKEHNEV